MLRYIKFIIFFIIGIVLGYLIPKKGTKEETPPSTFPNKVDSIIIINDSIEKVFVYIKEETNTLKDSIINGSDSVNYNFFLDYINEYQLNN